MELDRATPELFAALATAQGEIENATKNAANPHFRSKYADLAEVLNTVRPVLAKHGIAVFQSTGFDGALVTVETVLAHSTGGLIASAASCVPAKTDAQGIGAATTYLRRYGLAAMCGVAQEDDDGQSAAHNGKPLDVVAVKPVETSKPAEAPKPVDITKINHVAAYIKDALSRGDDGAVVEAFEGLTDEEKSVLWRAETKGGYFSQAEKTAIREAKFSLYKESAA